MDNKTIIEMTSHEAREFLLKGESYFNCELPAYINLDRFIKEYANKIGTSNKYSDGINKRILSNKETTNYSLFANKDGRYDWRSLQMIHPYIYVHLVNFITTESRWKEIQDVFSANKSKYIDVTSIPVKAKTQQRDKEEQIIHWWEYVEQESIKLSLKYDYIAHLDISNCYGSIYTHTIPWAFYGKEEAKRQKHDSKSKRNVGNSIDSFIQDMQNRQTNGIPQGSVLMDLIAEIVLSYADILFEEKVNKHNFDFKIIRYRDDYKVFCNSKENLEEIIKILNDVLMGLNFKLNSHKTKFSDEVILSSVKSDKLAYFETFRNLYYKNTKGEYLFNIDLQKHLLVILKYSKSYPNSGGLNRALSDFYNMRLDGKNHIDKNHVYQLVSIVVEVMRNNFKSVSICVLILSKLFTSLNEEEIDYVVVNILRKIKKTPNVDLINIWMQRLTIMKDRKHEYETDICKLVSKDICNIFEFDWIQRKFGIKDEYLIDEDQIANLQPVISKEEILLFNQKY